jgi:rhodanese-related sulfurtransferase
VVRTLLETVVVLLAGVVLAFSSNAMRDRGLELDRDYFPSGVSTSAGTVAPVVDPAGAALDPELPNEPPAEPSTIVSAKDTDGAPQAQPGGEGALVAAPDPTLTDTHDPITERLAEKGLTAIGDAELMELVEDPMFAAGAYLLVDARRAEQYAEGHLPGALHLDPFFPDAGLPQVLPMLPVAQRIVVYCTGGQCEDSESAALLLLQFGAPADRLAVYVGGVTEWTAAGRPLETE